MTTPVVTVFGGSGFLGRHVVGRLARRGWTVRVAGRDPENAKFLQPLGDVAQITAIAARLQDPASVAAAVAGADAVVNLVGILYERGHQNFGALHVNGARHVAEAAAAAGVRHLLHVSAIGADMAAAADYARSKAYGEQAVRQAFPGAVILRPSIVIGPEDAFFNRFAVLARLSPVLPLIGGGKTRFQPVSVTDVAEAVATALTAEEAAGQTYELGGPRIYTFKELMELLLAQIQRRRLLVPVPFWVADLQAAFLQLLPVPPLTPDQVRLLRCDTVVSEGALTLADLGIRPTAIEVVVPAYLARHRPHGGGGRLRSA